MNKDPLAEEKTYTSHRQCSVSKRTMCLEKIKQFTKQTLKHGIIVTKCLSLCDECNGHYEDSTGRFKIQCQCECHFNEQGVEVMKLQ